MTARIGAVASRLTHIVVAVVFAAAVVGCRNGGTQEDGHSTNNRLARQSDGLAASETFRQLSPRGAPVTFNRDVAPILFRRCSTCHRPGEAGPFDLLTYNDAKTRREQIVYVTQQHIMPPWLPEEACEEFVGQRHLTKEELDTIAKWVQQGAVEGDAADLPAAPRWTEGWHLGEPDLVLELPETHELRADGLDVFHTYVLPIPVARTRYVKAVEVRPDNRRVVHHALLMTDRTGSLRPLDQKHPGPGFPSPETGQAGWPEGHMPGYLPGRQTLRGRDDIAWRLEPGTDAVLQLHMVPSGKPEKLQVRVGFYWANAPPKRETMLLGLRGEYFDIAPGDKNYQVHDEFVLPVDVEIFAIQPHAHYLATTMRGSARLPDGTEKSLLYIKQWDFNWQEGYEYAKSVFLPKGTTISMRYSYDNSAENPRNPRQPPQRVTFGWKTTNEMAEFNLQVSPKSPGDLALLRKAYRLHVEKRSYAQPVESLRHAYRNVPHTKTNRQRLALAEFLLGNALHKQGKIVEAIEHYRQSVRISPDAEAHTNLGTALNMKGAFDEAIGHFRQALQINPDDAKAHAGLGAALGAQGDVSAAIGHYTRALELKPDPTALNNLAWIRATHRNAAFRDGDQAVALAERCCQLTGYRKANAVGTLAAAYAEAGRFDDAIKWQTKAIELAPVPRKAGFRALLEFYRAGKPYRDGSGDN